MSVPGSFLVKYMQEFKHWDRYSVGAGVLILVNGTEPLSELSYLGVSRAYIAFFLLIVVSKSTPVSLYREELRGSCHPPPFPLPTADVSIEESDTVCLVIDAKE